MLHVNDHNIMPAIERTGVTALYLTASWCTSCKAMKPILDRIEKEYQNKALFLTCDVEESTEVAVKYRVISVPTLIIFKDGVVAERKSGFLSDTRLKGILDAVCAG